jgi:hypothetical protein
MADLAGLGVGPGYGPALDRIWDSVVGAKLYITGSVGTAQFGDEGFGTAYNLPNEKAYCETCAAAANIFWNARMNLLRADAKYVDVLELALYNGFLSGVSLSGDLFFYQNPLASSGKARRDTWSDPACCPSNVVRLIPQIGEYLYARDADGIYVNLYAGSTADIPWKGGSIRLVQTTRYTWEGSVKISVEPAAQGEFALNLRIPGWAGERPVKSDLYAFSEAPAGDQPRPKISVNGRSVVNPELENGYLRIRRTWKKGDVVGLNLPMPVRRVRAHEAVEADRGRVALMSGPIVFCLEKTDNLFDINDLWLPGTSPIKAGFRGSFLGGVTVLEGRGTAGDKTAVDFTAVPYFAWANRGPG